MESNQYKVVAKEVSGISIIGVTIENKDGNKKNVSISDAIKLARSKKLENAVARFDVVSGKYMIDVEGGIDNLENSDRTKGLKLVLLGRLLNVDRKCIGYRAQDSKGKVYKLSISKVWDLAERGSIVGIKAKISNSCRVLESTELCNLQELPVFRN